MGAGAVCTSMVGGNVCAHVLLSAVCHSRRRTAAGASMIVYPGAFNTTTGPAHWELLLRARAVDNQVQ